MEKARIIIGPFVFCGCGRPSLPLVFNLALNFGTIAPFFDSKMSALGATMRKLVHLCFGVIKTRKPYQADYALSA